VRIRNLYVYVIYLRIDISSQTVSNIASFSPNLQLLFALFLF